MDVPDTWYVAVGNSDVAYQVIGEGQDLLFCYGLGGHIDLYWRDFPDWSMFSKLASFTRLILFDRRGTGASDGVPQGNNPTWEEWAEDFGAVLEAAGSEHAAIFATLDSGPIAILVAAMHPERVKALILLNTGARVLATEDYSIGVTPEAVDALVSLIANGWGTPGFHALMAPSAPPAIVADLARMARASATPRAAAAQYDYILRHVDVREALPLIQAPTLVCLVRDNPFVPIELGRYLADNITGASFVDLPGTDLAHVDLMAEVAEFLTGEAPPHEVERVLTTVLFTDIVGSTERAASLGDQRWRGLLQAHDRQIREHLRRFRGIEVNTTGDGFVASFDGPARAIRCAQAMSRSIRDLGLELRVGLHTGECEVRGEDLGGLAVHIAARVAALAAPGEVLASRTVKDLVVGSGIEFSERGEHDLRGVPGPWRLFAAR